MFFDTNRSYAWAATAMWDAKCLVQVQMAYVSANFTRRAKPNLRIHVCSIHINLTAVLVDKLTSLFDLWLKDTKGAGIGDHDGAELLIMFFAFCFQIGHIQVTSYSITLYSNDTHSRHCCARRICAVCRDWDKTDVALLAWLLFLILHDNPETSELALGTRVWLKRHRVETCNLGQILLQLLDHYCVALCLVGWNERMD